MKIRIVSSLKRLTITLVEGKHTLIISKFWSLICLLPLAEFDRFYKLALHLCSHRWIEFSILAYLHGTINLHRVFFIQLFDGLRVFHDAIASIIPIHHNLLVTVHVLSFRCQGVSALLVRHTQTLLHISRFNFTSQLSIFLVRIKVCTLEPIQTETLNGIIHTSVCIATHEVVESLNSGFLVRNELRHIHVLIFLDKSFLYLRLVVLTTHFLGFLFQFKGIGTCLPFSLSSIEISLHLLGCATMSKPLFTLNYVLNFMIQNAIQIL